jgi:hypothetical protein
MAKSDEYRKLIKGRIKDGKGRQEISAEEVDEVVRLRITNFVYALKLLPSLRELICKALSLLIHKPRRLLFGDESISSERYCSLYRKIYHNQLSE